MSKDLARKCITEVGEKKDGDIESDLKWERLARYVM